MTDNQPSGHIVAMGGGGFSMEPDNPLLDPYILGLAGKDAPEVCFVPPSGDAPGYVERFYAAFGRLPCRPSHLSLYNPPTADLREFVFARDIVYVGGGNTKSMLALWREWGFDDIIREFWERGGILAGLSAGSICWFAQGVTDSIPGALTVLPCLGLLAGSNCPHYDGEPERRPAYQRFVAAGLIADGYACDDGVALHFEGDQLARVVNSRSAGKAYRLDRTANGATETPIEPEYLG